MSNTLSIYKASAGAGKTFTLTVEYILLLLTKGRKEYEHTLAVTFTNKATAEMKERILETLYGLAHSLKESEGYLQVIRKRLEEMDNEMSPEIIRLRSAEALTSILHDYTHFRVETIDSFFQSVLHNLAHELGLTANLTVELNNDEVISRSVDRVIETMQDHRDVQSWIMDYVEEQLLSGDKWNVSGIIKNFARCIYEEAFQNRTREEREKLADTEQMKDFKSRMHAIIRDGKKQLLECADALEKLIDSKELNFSRISYGSRYVSYINLLRGEKLDSPSASIITAADNYESLLAKKDRNNDTLIRDAQEISLALKDSLALLETLRKDIITARLCLKYLNPIRLLGVIEQEANDINNENNQFNLSKTPTLLSRLVEKSDAPFVFEKIGTQFHNVMIDEFQDTSRLQWNNFKTLLLENQSTGGRDLLVGDIKQSIYRWRNGDWAILKNVKQELAMFQPQDMELRFNFRSQKVIIDFNNAFFPRAAAALDEVKPDARFSIRDIYSDVEQLTNKTSDAGFAYVTLYTRKGKAAPVDYEERMATDMVQNIRSMISRGLTTKDFAILGRNKKSATKLIHLFQQLAPEIKLISDEAFLLEASTAVQMIVAALQTLNDAKELNPIPQRYLMMHYSKEVLHKPLTMLQVASLSPEEVLPEAFTSHKRELAQLPLYLLCERLYQILHLDTIQEQDCYLFTFMDELQNHLRSNPSDIHTFLQAWEDNISFRSIPGGEVNGIRILTIHKSKGLQFHTVLLPFMDWTVESNVVADDSIWCHSTIQPYNQLGTLPINSGVSMKESHFSNDYEEEHLQRRVDALNMIYVAFTRAENNLLVWGSTSEKGESISSAGDLIRKGLTMEVSEEDLLHYETGTPFCSHGKAEEKSQNRMKSTAAETDAIDVSMSSCPPTLDFMQSNQSRKFITSLDSQEEEQPRANEGQTYLEIGKIMHYVLSQIEHEGQLQKVLSRCQAEGLIADEKVKKTVIARIRKGISHPQIAQWFSAKNEVFNECSITSINPQTREPYTLRPDRVVINGDRITVIDFKFGKHSDEYNTQVQQYMNLMKAMYPSHSVEGYLWYIYSGSIKEVVA